MKEKLIHGAGALKAYSLSEAINIVIKQNMYT